VSDPFDFSALGDKADEAAMETVESGLSRLVNNGLPPVVRYGSVPDDADEALRQAIFVLLIQSYIIGNDNTVLEPRVAPDRATKDVYWLQPISGTGLLEAITEVQQLAETLRDRLIVEARCPQELLEEHPVKPHASVLHMVPYGLKLAMLYHGRTIYVHGDTEPEWLAEEARRVVRHNLQIDSVGPLRVY